MDKIQIYNSQSPMPSNDELHSDQNKMEKKALWKGSKSSKLLHDINKRIGNMKWEKVGLCAIPNALIETHKADYVHTEVKIGQLILSTFLSYSHN